VLKAQGLVLEEEEAAEEIDEEQELEEGDDDAVDLLTRQTLPFSYFFLVAEIRFISPLLPLEDTERE
jgi:hypothetical protein